jgi:hypothetical protein
MIVNKDWVYRNITTNDGKQVPYRWTHGATDYHMGDGLMVYALVQHMRAKTCVCLGSGGGFIPRIMTQARKELYHQEIFTGNPDNNWGDIGVTYIVDAANGVGGFTDWTKDDSFFRSNFHPRVILKTTEEAYYNYFVKEGVEIDYLHIDADHSYEGVKKDFDMYSKLVKKSGIITLHDTDQKYHDNYIVTDDIKPEYYEPFDGPAKLLKEIGPEWKVFNFFNEGNHREKPSSTGFTLIQHA